MISTPVGIEMCFNLSIVSGLVFNKIIKRLWILLSNCSRLDLFTCGERRMVKISVFVGKGIGPLISASVAFAVSIIFFTDLSSNLWSYEYNFILNPWFTCLLPPVTMFVTNLWITIIKLPDTMTTYTGRGGDCGWKGWRQERWARSWGPHRGPRSPAGPAPRAHRPGTRCGYKAAPAAACTSLGTLGTAVPSPCSSCSSVEGPGGWVRAWSPGHILIGLTAVLETRGLGQGQDELPRAFSQHQLGLVRRPWQLCL